MGCRTRAGGRRRRLVAGREARRRAQARGGSGGPRSPTARTSHPGPGGPPAQGPGRRRRRFAARPAQRPRRPPRASPPLRRAARPAPRPGARSRRCRVSSRCAGSGRTDAAEDQALPRPRRGDVEEAQALLGVACFAGLDQLAVVVEVERRAPRGGATAGPPEAAARGRGRGRGGDHRRGDRGRGRGRRRPRTPGPWRCGRS